MSYTVKEIFLTLQGEGARAGRRAVFVRFTGCNLWSGREADRHKAACTFCDTDFVGGTRYRARRAGRRGQRAVGLGARALRGADRRRADAAGGCSRWSPRSSRPASKSAIETNGTLAVEPAIDWVCVSPKAGTQVVQRSGNELKLVYPQAGADPQDFAGWAFEHFFLQPMDGPEIEANTAAAVQRCIDDGRWRLSVQTHKMVGIR